MKSIQQKYQEQKPEVKMSGFFWTSNVVTSFKKSVRLGKYTITEDCKGVLLFPINHPLRPDNI